jgi:hypothetical protein
MRIEGNFKTVCTGLDVSDLKSAILKLPDSSWENDTVRQDEFPTARATKSILLKFNGPTQQKVHPRETKTFDAWNTWEGLVLPIVEKVQEHYPPSVISKCFFPKLLALGTIRPHIDGGDTLELVHRIHIPLVTNEDVIFTVGGESINMKEGCAYEINNQEMHGVRNYSNQHRIHLMVDLYCGD